MTRKRVGLMGLMGAVLLLFAVEPAVAQSTSSTTTENLIWELNNQLIYVAVPITVLVEGILIYAVWKFAKSDEAQPTQENRRLEITWTVATAVILLFVGVASYQVLGNPYVSASAQAQVEEPQQMEEIQVYAYAYGWDFQYHDVNAEGVAAEGLTLENVSLEGGTVTNTTDNGAVVENAQLSGDSVEATLDTGVVSGVEASQGESVDAADVTVSEASISNGELTGATVESSGTVAMPVDRDVRLNITSRDLLHAFHVPSMGLKSDAFPGKSNYINTRPTETGTHQLYCAEYCGVGHSGMLGSVTVHSQDEHEQWLVDKWVESKQ